MENMSKKIYKYCDNDLDQRPDNILPEKEHNTVSCYPKNVFSPNTFCYPPSQYGPLTVEIKVRDKRNDGKLIRIFLISCTSGVIYLHPYN